MIDQMEMNSFKIQDEYHEIRTQIIDKEMDLHQKIVREELDEEYRKLDSELRELKIWEKRAQLALKRQRFKCIKWRKTVIEPIRQKDNLPWIIVAPLDLENWKNMTTQANLPLYISQEQVQEFNKWWDENITYNNWQKKWCHLWSYRKTPTLITNNYNDRSWKMEVATLTVRMNGLNQKESVGKLSERELIQIVEPQILRKECDKMIQLGPVETDILNAVTNIVTYKVKF